MTSSIPKRRKPRLTREEKARQTRDSLLNAGCVVVAAEGYANASIAKIANLAGVAHGTFYNYFGDRQDLFDQLLPFEGLRMRDAVERLSRDAAPGIDREVRRFEAFLEYVSDNPGFYRVLYEAEIFSPEAHRAHMSNIVSGYMRSFHRAISEGRMLKLDDASLTCLIHQLLGIRAYSAMQIHYAGEAADHAAIKATASGVYRLLLSKSLYL